MFLLILSIIIVVVLVGIILQKLFPNEITKGELYITSGVLSCVIIPLTIFLGWKLSVNSRISFQEYRNGWETKTIHHKIKCTRDGVCKWCYDCDPYIVMVSYSCGTSKQPRTCLRAETRYHSCPYVTEEWTFTVETTIRNFTIDANRFPDNYKNMLYRSKSADNIAVQAGIGIPARWDSVDKRLKANTPGPVTGLFGYKNYILPSSQSVWRKDSSAVNDYRTRNLLPKFNMTTYDFYRANKVYSVGLVEYLNNWNTNLAYVNGYIGKQLQGDLQLILVNNRYIDQNPDRYTNAVEAYWKNIEVFEHNAVAKNALVVIMGTDGNKVLWSRAFSGMPIGNEKFIIGIRNMKNIPFDPDSALGIVKVDNTLNHTSHRGYLTELLTFSSNKYQRVDMDKFSYLKNQIDPLTSQLVAIIFVALFLSSIGWGIAFWNNITSRKGMYYENHYYR